MAEQKRSVPPVYTLTVLTGIKWDENSVLSRFVVWAELALFVWFVRQLSMKVKNDHRRKFSNLSNCKEEAWKKNQGFNGIRTRDLRVAGALLYQLSYEATHWERGQFIELISPVRRY